MSHATITHARAIGRVFPRLVEAYAQALAPASVRLSVFTYRQALCVDGARFINESINEGYIIFNGERIECAVVMLDKSIALKYRKDGRYSAYFIVKADKGPVTIELSKVK